MASVSGRIFAITGGASGIGAATCRLLAQRGAAVICIADRDSTHFASLQESIAVTSPLTLVQCAIVDVTSSEAVSAWVNSVVSTHGDLHGAANVAGIAQASGLRRLPTILDETDDEWNRVLRVNLDGVFFSTRAQVAAMMNKGLADRSRRRRSIVNVASIAALYHEPDVYAYGTSKQACAYFSACVAADVVSLGIRVNCVSPGITNTPLLPQFEPKAAGLDEIRALYDSRGLAVYEADDVARTIAWLLSDDSWPVYGANINVGAHGP